MGRSSFKSIQLKFKLRNGVSGLGEDLYCQKRGSGLCKKCGYFETLKHFIFHCKAYTAERQALYNSIKHACDDNVFNLFLQNLDFALCLLLGDHDDCFNEHFLKFIAEAWIIRDGS